MLWNIDNAVNAGNQKNTPAGTLRSYSVDETIIVFWKGMKQNVAILKTSAETQMVYAAYVLLILFCAAGFLGVLFTGFGTLLILLGALLGGILGGMAGSFFAGIGLVRYAY